jgi:hypothetical protein
VPELESELRSLIHRSRLPPSSVKMILETYALQSRSLTDDQRKSYLAQLIVAYRNPQLRLQPGEDRPLADLVQVYMTMETKNPLTEATRRQILDNVLKGYDGETVNPLDRDWYKRIGVAGLIRSYAVDPGILRGK